MKAVITYKNGEKETILKLTEIHYNYLSFEKSVAFESDIKQTGCTKRLKDIKEIEIFNR